MHATAAARLCSSTARADTKPQQQQQQQQRQQQQQQQQQPWRQKQALQQQIHLINETLSTNALRRRHSS
ncbi:hypothetical protein ACSSS7_005847 [Eimeria intestinalis]